MKRFQLVFIIICFVCSTIFSQAFHLSNVKHNDKITAITSCVSNKFGEPCFFTSGQDGVVVRWTNELAGEHYQVSNLPIKYIAQSPNNKEIAICETDGKIYKISVWDWTKLTKRYSKIVKAPVTSLAYSAKGSWLLIGTASVKGTIFLNTINGGVVDKIKDNIGQVSYAKTSDSEKSIVQYSPKGFLLYYNMATGENKAKINVESDLSNVYIWGTGKTCYNMFLSGIKDNKLYIINALSGKNIACYAAYNSVVFYDATGEQDCIYYTSENGNSHALYKLNQDALFALLSSDNGQILQPTVVKQAFTLQGEKLTAGARYVNNLLLGTQSGNLYIMDTEESSVIQTLQPITSDNYKKITDLYSIENDIVYLTNEGVYSTNYESGIIRKITGNNNATNITKLNDASCILWSKDTINSVCLLDIPSGIMQDLFLPEKNIEALSVSGSKIAYLLGTTQAYIYDIATKKTTLCFQGSGLEDLLLYKDKELYIAKSNTGELGSSSLLCVNIETSETIYLKTDANIMLNLAILEDEFSPQIYVVGLQENETKVYSFSPATKTVSSIITSKQEDTNTFIYASNTCLYYTIGQSILRSYDTKKRLGTMFTRRASLPKKVCQTQTKIAVLNADGSLSWYMINKAIALADWYMTKTDQWYEY